ncbi:hypothetical protein RB2654_14400 [Rhodobacterales bacterium HTCC2654]|uniref:Uncharacterized protein n=1 Tax=Maritimibacter alkaliphilus HTCC2654 TaxID=314271 RepID=A3VGS9_9RHOB|nr:hypothetical protein RB2654_14400 [Rhodobacterales bacterium HTCC2654] [Maritimibacter alkaliphilus HTCC2654]
MRRERRQASVGECLLEDLRCAGCVFPRFPRYSHGLKLAGHADRNLGLRKQRIGRAEKVNLRQLGRPILENVFRELAERVETGRE